MAKKIKYDFNPFALTGESAKGLGSRRAGVLSEIASMVTDAIRDKASVQTSTVSKRGKWKSLSTAYAKAEKGGNRTANLRLSNDMMNGLNTHKRSGNTLRTTVQEDDQGKADGHNNFTGNSPLPERRFIPNATDGETWNKSLVSAMREIIKRAKDDS